MQISPYLNFNGQCGAAFKFYEKCLGGKIEDMHTYASTPMGLQVPADWRSKIIHARLTLEGSVLLGSDVTPDRYQQPQGFSVTLEVKNPAEAERIFHLLSENATVQMPIQETFWAARFGMLTDQFGIPWMVNSYKAA